MTDDISMARCRCGTVTLELRGAPIARTVCDCAYCRAAARALGALPGAAPIVNDSGGVAYVLFRKDRVRCTSGQSHLREHRLRPGAPTRRVVADCCNSFMFADFTRGHWLSLAQDRLDATSAIATTPQADRHSAGFLARLALTWMRMGFRVPKIAGMPARLNGL